MAPNGPEDRGNTQHHSLPAPTSVRGTQDNIVYQEDPEDPTADILVPVRTRTRNSVRPKRVTIRHDTCTSTFPRTVSVRPPNSDSEVSLVPGDTGE